MAKNVLRFIVFSLSILAWVSSPSPILAACNTTPIPIDLPCVLGTPYRCSYVTSSGGSFSTCCSDADSCVAYKADLAEGTAINNNPASRDIFYPTGECGEGAIDSALGCIPYTTEAFGPALLGFLAGIVGAISLIVMLFATAQIMMAGGDAEAVKKGKELFTGAVTGLLFIIFSVTLLRIIAGDIIQLPGFEG